MAVAVDAGRVDVAVGVSAAAWSRDSAGCMTSGRPEIAKSWALAVTSICSASVSTANAPSIEVT